MSATALRNIDLDSALDEAKRRHTEDNPTSLARFETAQESLIASQAESRLPFGIIFNYCAPTFGVGYMFFLVGLYCMAFSTDVLKSGAETTVP